MAVRGRGTPAASRAADGRAGTPRGGRRRVRALCRRRCRRLLVERELDREHARRRTGCRSSCCSRRAPITTSPTCRTSSRSSSGRCLLRVHGAVLSVGGIGECTSAGSAKAASIAISGSWPARPGCRNSEARSLRSLGRRPAAGARRRLARKLRDRRRRARDVSWCPGTTVPGTSPLARVGAVDVPVARDRDEPGAVVPRREREEADRPRWPSSWSP